MIESKIYDDTIYNWNFKDGASIVNNERVKATKYGNPTFSGGVATFTLNDYYQFKSIINIGIKYTIAVKFKLDDISLPAAIRMLAGTNASAIYGFLINNSSQTVSHNTGGTLATISFTKDLNWHEFVVSRNGSSGKIYIDGVEQTITGSFSATVPLIFKTMIGTNDATPIGKIPGKLEYIRIWNRALTASEVTNNYRGVTFKTLPYFGNEVLGSELVINGNFDAGSTGWGSANGNLTYNAGTSDITVVSTVASGDCRASQTIAGVSTGKRYRLKFRAKSTVYAAPLVANRYYINATFITNPVMSSVYQDYEMILYPTADNTVYLYTPITTGQDTNFDNVSLKEIVNSPLNCLFHINSYRGVIRDLVNKVTPVATNVLLKTIGSGVKVMQFNGTSGNISIGNNALTGDITVMCWINNLSLGEGGQANIITNGSGGNYFTLGLVSSISYYFRRSGVTPAYSGSNTVKFGKWVFLCVTSTATGITNYYIGDAKTPPILTGTANQAAGTPAAGTTTYLGNNTGDSATMNGSIGEIRMDASILTLADITQFWSDTKSLYI